MNAAYVLVFKLNILPL